MIIRCEYKQTNDSNCGNTFAESESNDTTGTADDNSITLSPGCTVKITGSIPGTGNNDYFKYNSGTANGVYFSISWVNNTGDILNIAVKDTLDSDLYDPYNFNSVRSTGAVNQTEILSYTSRMNNATRYIVVEDASVAADTYTLTISAY